MLASCRSGGQGNHFVFRSRVATPWLEVDRSVGTDCGERDRVCAWGAVDYLDRCAGLDPRIDVLKRHIGPERMGASAD